MLLVAAKLNIMIKAQSVKEKKNGLIEALFRFDDNKLMTLVLWQNLLNLMTRPPFIYLQHPAQ